MGGCLADVLECFDSANTVKMTEPQTAYCCREALRSLATFIHYVAYIATLRVIIFCCPPMGDIKLADFGYAAQSTKKNIKCNTLLYLLFGGSLVCVRHFSFFFYNNIGMAPLATERAAP